jgi:transcriptional regulator with GAF, ATPase, and Fis domain
MNSPKTQLSVNREVIADASADRAILRVLNQFGPEIQAIGNTQALSAKLLELLCTRIPAKRGAILLVVPNTEDLEPVAFRGKSFEVPSQIVDWAFRERLASISSGMLCVPLCLYDMTVGAIYLESSRADAFTAHHMQLAIAVAWEAAVSLRFARHADGLRAQTRVLRKYAGIAAIVGKSARINALRDAVQTVAPVESTVLIQGEMGTGKELIAQAIHELSPRREYPCMPVNCAALPPDLTANELFGNQRGAFTGALGTAGKVEEASGGTLFLDEIGDLAPSSQGMLLRVLEQRQFQRVGGTQTIHANVRVVAATNVDLAQAVGNKKFRGDLFHRLNVFPIEAPALRDIPGDIPLLAEHFCKTLLSHFRVADITPDTMKILVAYGWPGNARELRNVLEYALIPERTGPILPEHLPPYVLNGTVSRKTKTQPEPTKELDEKAAIEDALRKTGGNVKQAGELLGIPLRTMWRLIRKYKIRRR